MLVGVCASFGGRTAAAAGFPWLGGGGQLHPTYLRCEYRVNPLGLDTPRPRLSWIVESDRRGQRQTAYQVLVASSAKALKANRPNIWDSGKVASDETTGVAYAGQPLPAHQTCYWKVRVWDADGKPSSWSGPAWWSMGLRTPGEWQAQWIGLDEPTPDPRARELETAKWLWLGDWSDPGSIAAGPRWFRRTVEIPADRMLKDARCVVRAGNRMVLYINGLNVATDHGWSGPKEFVVTENLRPGTNVLAVSATNPAPGSAGVICGLVLTFADGTSQTIVSDAAWLATDKNAQGWQKPGFDASAWQRAREVGPYGCAPWGQMKVDRYFVPPPKYLRREFTVGKPVRKAWLHATALGIYQMHLNGRRVGDDYFSPGWTDYSKRVYYRTYDVTDQLRQGNNALGAILADGWYAGYIGYLRERNHYGSKPRLMAQLYVEYADGSTQVVTTDESWKATVGPILEADFLMGETYDGRLEMPGWARAGFADGRWSAVHVGAEMSPVVQAAVNQPVVEWATVKPVSVSEPALGRYVLDMGQNFAGVVRLSVQEAKGRKIVLRFAERLNADGTIYTENLRTARTTDAYICKGIGRETWQPCFTFHGFQYVEVTGLTKKPGLDLITGLALSSDTPVAGQFSCSDDMINRLYRNIVWTQRANFIDIPTDCPQRDERLGWTGDAQVYVATACLNADVQAFFSKWLTDLTDAQRADGQFPCVAPLKVAGADGGPGWADAGVICPWTIYQVYGDRQLLERHYDAMKHFIAFCRDRSTPDLLPPPKYHCFGDWLNISADTPKDVIYLAYFAHSTHLTAQAARLLGKTDDARELDDLCRRIKTAFNRAYVDDQGCIAGDTQAAYVLALAYDLLDHDQQRLAADRLIEKIQSRDGRLSTGFLGTKDLMLVLAKIGRNDVASRLLHNDTFPSWGFSIKHGATSIWERWDGWTPDQGFQDPGMNSFAHYSFGAVGQWIFENVAGIQSAAPGYKKIIIRPQPGGRLTHAQAAYRSPRGEIRSRWRLRKQLFTLDVSIPANAAATVYLPAPNPAAVRESGKPLAQAPGVKLIDSRPGETVLDIASGTYRFQTPLP